MYHITFFCMTSYCAKWVYSCTFCIHVWTTLSKSPNINEIEKRYQRSWNTDMLADYVKILKSDDPTRVYCIEKRTVEMNANISNSIQIFRCVQKNRNHIWNQHGVSINSHLSHCVDLSSSYHCKVRYLKCWIVHTIIGNVSFV